MAAMVQGAAVVPVAAMFWGDLVHIKRDPLTGQPILQKRWIELPGNQRDWGYCPIPIEADGAELPFAELSCDPLDPAAVVEVDYFGRLSGGRTKERNSRMHFNEVISSIRAAEVVEVDASGRLALGYDCQVVTPGTRRCDSWSTIDSPMENLALYTRLMKYGHFQTDPLEVDIFAHGDPAAGVQYHPALAPGDWAKFSDRLRHLLPTAGAGGPDSCFAGGTFDTACAQPESLTNADFGRAATLLGAAANKDGRISVDLVQYMNRILKITLDTENTQATPDTLPALVRDCGPNPDAQLATPDCLVEPAVAGLPAPADEQFVDFGQVSYVRSNWHDVRLTVLVPLRGHFWTEARNIDLLEWLEYANGSEPRQPVAAMSGFLAAALDGLRTIEFIHNYAIPEDLGWDFR